MPKTMQVAGEAGDEDEGGDRDRAAEIDPGQAASASTCGVESQPAESESDGVGEPDHRERPAADRGGEAGILEIGRQVRGDEGELEAAGEEAEHQEHVGAVLEGLASAPARSTGSAAARGPPHRCVGAGAARRERKRERQHQEHGGREDHERLMPAERVDQDVADRREEELAEGAGRRARPRRPCGRQFSGRSLPKAPSTRLNEQPERPKPISTPAPRWSMRGRRRIGHDDEAGA